MTVRCEGCGDTFPRHPALEVACPSCKAALGTGCLRPSEHRISSGFGIHAARRKLAFKLNPCRCLANWEKHQAQQLTLDK